MSMLSIDTTESDLGCISAMMPLDIRCCTTRVASLRFVLRDATAPTRLSILTSSCDPPWHRMASVNRQ